MIHLRALRGEEPTKGALEAGRFRESFSACANGTSNEEILLMATVMKRGPPDGCSLHRRLLGVAASAFGHPDATSFIYL